jgi:hypothetical protein
MIFPENSGWNKKTYDFYLIFGTNIPGKEPWVEEEWFNTFEPIFNKLIEISPHKKDTGIRVLEYAKKNEDDQYYKEHKLGRLRWDKQSHEKWTLKHDDRKLFGQFEAWTPLWTMCEKNHTSPDIYFSFWNESNVYKELQFDTFVTVAINDETGNISKEMIIELSKGFNSKRTVFNKRRWGEGKIDPEKKWSFINSILDTHSFGIYKDEKVVRLNIHSIPFEEIKFEPYWEIIY